MPPWWGRSSSKEAKKKSGKDNVVENFNSRKSKVPSEETSGLRAKAGSRRRYLDTTSEKGSVSRAGSRSPSPSNQVSRCQSFADRALSQPLPLPNSHALESHKKPEIVEGRRKACDYRVHSSLRSLPVPERTPNRPDATDVDGGLGTASISSECSMDSDDPSDAQHSGGCIPISPRAREYSSKAVASSTGRPKNFKNSRESLKPAISLPSSQISSSPSKRRPLSTIEHPPSLQIPHHGAFGSAPDSSMSSPSRSPLRVFPAEQQCGGFWAVKSYLDTAQFGSGHCSSPGSGHNSGHNSMGGDMAGQFFWQHSRGSPECSPIPSPRTTSPGPSSRIHSGAVTPLHPRAGGNGPESPSSWQEEGKHHQCHKLPLPPLTISNVNPFGPSNTSANASSPVPRSPGKPDNPPSPGSRWKKGKLLGQGTFGHVYVGFSNESGDMCAMKEVTLFADDAKSKESAKQLAQEIAVLSRLRHPNIVQYYGSETVDDKLYIYLEYVSGGSIHKLLQEYGYFSDPVIRSYTQQILSGLAYLHAKNTVHRDIKGANILVDPNGRVKLADFGMAKHITGHSLPLSFKGSPYWMAPEVIRNSNGCNLAVDIWSLGCTVLEMATTKPPWSQYEGVAALFKIGNSKELPAIPDSLSDEGKDFVRVCLQRNPTNRPTAAQLLEHPFVKNAAPLIRPDIRNDMSDVVNDVASTIEQMSGGHTRHLSTLDMEAAAMKQHGGVKSFHASRSVGTIDGNIPRNLSLPVSPSASPLCHSRSPPNLSGRLSPPSISSPITMSGSSTPLTGGNGALPYHAMKQMSVYYNDNYGLPRSPPGLYPNPASSIAYSESKPDMFLGMQPDRVPVIRERMENNFLVTSSGRPVHRENNLQYRGQVALAEHVSQLLRSPNKSPPDVRRSMSPLPGRGGGA